MIVAHLSQVMKTLKVLTRIALSFFSLAASHWPPFSV